MENYPTMYSLITQASRNAISQDDFTKRYTDDLNAMSVKSIEYNILSMLTDPQSSQVSFHIIYHTGLFGDIQRDFNTNAGIGERSMAAPMGRQSDPARTGGWQTPDDKL